MAEYRTLFSLHIAHGFYAGACSCLRFVPTATTHERLENLGLLVKQSSSGILVAFDRARQDAIRMCLEDESTGLRLAFKAYPKDPLFRVYTEPFTQQANNLLYFTNQQISRKKQGVFRLHKSEFVSPESLVNLGTEVLDAVLSKQDRYIPPALAVSIQAEGKNNPLFDSAGKPKAPTYLIKFASRRTYWRYYLVGSKMDDSVFIIDTDDGIGFESTELITLSDGRTAHSCRSIKSIPLQQSYPYKFQLKQRKNGGEKILFRQLPFPKVGQTGIEVVAKQAVVVSEIFVNY